MIINKLYSNNNTFPKLEFKTGMNLIIGGLLDSNNKIKYNQHNVGKTLTIEIIDFCFLSDFNDEKTLFKFRNYSAANIKKIEKNLIKFQYA